LLNNLRNNGFAGIGSSISRYSGMLLLNILHKKKRTRKKETVL